MIPKPLIQIQLSDLTDLLGNVRESKTIEFKEAMPAKTDKEVIQFLAGVSALANTAGGDFLIGISSTDGVASAVNGIPVAGYDSERLRLEQLLADNIEPRLPAVTFHSVECGNGKHVIIIRVPQSWLSPHRVSKNDKFYGRNSGGKYPLDVGELRNAFGLRENVAERIREFRRGRLLKIMNGETPGRLTPSTSMVLHVIPIPSFADRRLINVAQETAARPITLPVPLGSTGVGHGINLDGLFIYSGPSLADCHGYGLLFRDASIEGVKQMSIREDRPYIAGSIFEQDVVRSSDFTSRFASSWKPGCPSMSGYLFAMRRDAPWLMPAQDTGSGTVFLSTTT